MAIDHAGNPADRQCRGTNLNVGQRLAAGPLGDFLIIGNL